MPSPRRIALPPALTAGPVAGPGRLGTDGPRIDDGELAAATSFPDDALLAGRVRSELLRGDDVPKGTWSSTPRRAS